MLKSLGGLAAGLAITGLVACTSANTAPTGPQAAPAPAPSVIAPAPATTTAPSTPTQASVQQDLFLSIAAPADESVVNESTVTVQGRTTPDAVVSVNEQVAAVDASGAFAMRLTLVEGPNTISIVASNFQGQQASKVLTVIYVR